MKSILRRDTIFSIIQIASDLVPLLGVDVIELCTGENLILWTEAAGDQNTSTALKLHPHAGVVTTRGQQAWSM